MTGDGTIYEEVVGPKLVPMTLIMRFAMRNVVQGYGGHEQSG